MKPAICLTRLNYQYLLLMEIQTHKINEEFLGMVEFTGKKGAKALFNLICEVLANKGIDIKQMKFNSMNETNKMSREHSGL